MIKFLKISSEKVPVKYSRLDENDAGEYDTEESCIRIKKGLSRHEHDETIVHEMVHAIQYLSSLRHSGISEDVWEIIAGEVGRAVADNFKLIEKKS